MESAPRVDIDWPHAAALVLAAEGPRQRRWAVSTAIEVVRKLAAKHPKVVLADLQRAPSSLSAALEVEAEEGIADVLFRGASFSAVAQRPESESFFFLTLGSSPPAKDVLFQHPRWPKIASRLAETGAHLLVCVSADEWLEAGPIPGFESCIVLNSGTPEVELPEGARRLAELLAPPEIREEGEPVAEFPWYASVEPAGLEEGEPEGEAVAEASDESAFRMVGGDLGEGAGRTWEAPLVGEGGGGELPSGRPFADHEADADVFGYRPSSDDGLVRRLTQRGILIPVIGLSAAAVLAFFVWGRGGGEPELAGADAGRVEAAAEPPPSAADETPGGPAGEVSGPAAEGGGATPVEVDLPYSVLIASFSSFEDALDRRREWGEEDDALFYVAPTPVRGVVYYRVFAGLLPDRERAEALMAELVEARIKQTASDWDVRPARLAFSFGTFPNERDAQAVVRTLESHGVPAYVVPAGLSAGGVGYRVFAGGYERPEDAAPLREQIGRAELADLDVELVERVGLRPR